MRLLTTLLIGGCLTATGALAQSKTEMQQVLDDWGAVFNKQDAGKVAMHYKSEATLFPLGNDMLQGGQNVAKPGEKIKIRGPVASKIRHLSVPQTGSYAMSDASSPRSSQQSEGNPPPGHSWLEIIKRPSPEAFAAAFTKDVVLDASVLPRSITGATDVRAFFRATRAMFDAVAFKHEVTVGSRTYLEWEGTFQGNNVAGLTVLTKDAAGLIESIRVYYRPYNVVVAFSADLAGRLAGNMTGDPFLGSALGGHP
jgi:ketosteroid isomerase-like protein